MIILIAVLANLRIINYVWILYQAKFLQYWSIAPLFALKPKKKRTVSTETFSIRIASGNIE